MTERLWVYLNGIRAGSLDWDRSLDVFSFRYLPDYLAMEDALALSVSLPLAEEPFDPLRSRAFFGNLLPPEPVRRKLEKILHHDRHNIFAFLKDLGGDCAGAISLYPDGTPPESRGEVLQELTEDDADAVLCALPSRPLLQGLVEGYRISLAGAQDKLVARVCGGKIVLPLYGAASTHLVKPRMAAWPGTVENECFCQRLAARLGLDAAKADILDVKAKAYYVSERYDRVREGNRVRRLLQEDFCQAMGVLPENKYEEDGGPSAVRCFRFLRDSGFGFAELSKFIDALVFNFLVGNADAHAKNFAILHRDGSRILAPLYDILSTQAYPEHASRMAMSIGGTREFSEVGPEAFDIFAGKCDINPKFVRNRIARLSDALPKAMESVAEELSDGGHPSPLYRQIAEQTRSRICQLA